MTKYLFSYDTEKGPKGPFCISFIPPAYQNSFAG